MNIGYPKYQYGYQFGKSGKWSLRKRDRVKYIPSASVQKLKNPLLTLSIARKNDTKISRSRYDVPKEINSKNIEKIRAYFRNNVTRSQGLKFDSDDSLNTMKERCRERDISNLVVDNIKPSGSSENNYIYTVKCSVYEECDKVWSKRIYRVYVNKRTGKISIKEFDSIKHKGR